MTEEKEEQGTNPPHEKPNESLLSEFSEFSNLQIFT